MLYTKCMKHDNRKLKNDVLYDLRKRAVRMKIQGCTHQAVANAFDVGESTVRKWWSLYKQGGSKPCIPKNADAGLARIDI